MRAKTAPRVRPLMVCWTRTSHHSIALGAHARGTAGSRRATSPGGRVPEGGWRTTPLRALLEDGLELELAADRPVRLHDLEAGHGVVVDVAVLVEVPLAVDAFEVLRRRDRLAHGLALLGHVLRALDLGRRSLDGVDDDARSFRGVERVRRGLLAELALVRLVRLGPDTP